MFELVDTTAEGWLSGRVPEGAALPLASVEFDTLAGALSRSRTREWSGVPWKIFGPDGTVVRTWGSGT